MKELRSEEWFKHLFSQHYDQLRNYLYYLSGDIHWTEDAVQEVFLILWEKRDSVRSESLLSFLFTIGRNLFLKQKRHEAVILKFKSQAEAGINLMDDPPAEDERLFDLRLQAALSGLPEKCRTVFLMSRIDELTNQGIAIRLGISVKAVEKHITKALKILRGKLEERS